MAYEHVPQQTPERQETRELTPQQDQPSMPERIGQLVTPHYNLIRNRAAIIGSTFVAALGVGGLELGSTANASEHHTGGGSLLIEGTSNFNLQAEMYSMQRKAVSSATWFKTIKHFMLSTPGELGKPVYSFETSSTVGYEDDCKKQGAYWQFSFEPAGAYSTHCGEGNFTIFGPSGHSHPGEFNKDMTLRSRALERSITVGNKPAQQAIRSSHETAVNMHIHTKELTAWYRCVPHRSGSTSSKGTAAAVEQNGIEKIVLNSVGKSTQQHTRATITVCK